MGGDTGLPTGTRIGPGNHKASQCVQYKDHAPVRERRAAASRQLLLLGAAGCLLRRAHHEAACRWAPAHTIHTHKHLQTHKLTHRSISLHLYQQPASTAK